MRKKLSGVDLPHRKNTSHTSPARLPVPSEVTLTMGSHIGSPARVVVKVGDTVGVGTLVGEANGAVSSNVHSSISGIVTEVTELYLPGGTKTEAVRIASDGEMRVSDSVRRPQVHNRDSFVRALRQSGIIGLGGAGFPTYVKYDVEPGRACDLIINAAECEPYITSDTATFTTRGDDVKRALEAIKEYLGVRRIIIGIERSNTGAYLAARHLAEGCEGVKVHLLRDAYPQGAEKVLIYHTTGKVTPAGRLPIDVGCIVSNISTVAEIGKYLSVGMPLVERCVSVDGGAVREAQNVIVPVGTRVADVLDFCGGVCEPPNVLLYGGPMMGVVCDGVQMPIMKNANAVLALTSDEVAVSKTTACIRCGSCFRACPFDIDPAAVARAYKRGAVRAVKALRIDACMECGCCAYVCPAKLPLVESNRLAKGLLRQSTKGAKNK